jgi:ABC-type uncharacterized transport system substrate-binding protein
MAKNAFRNRISGILLHREIQRRKRTNIRSFSFENIKSIGILYDATDDHDFELVKAYTRNLMSHSKEVVALGFYGENELPAKRLMKLGLDFFAKKALNWKMRPSNPIVNNFIGKSFDVLILLNTHRCIPLVYAAMESKASFKIGRFESGLTGLLDFMVKDEGKTTMKDLLNHVNHYLMLIKNEKKQ